MLRERGLARIWYGDVPPPWWLRALAAIYAGLSAVRRGLYRGRLLQTIRLPLPVIVVGNISVGGAGKTPVTMALIEDLRARGFRPGVVSRGYGEARVDRSWSTRKAMHRTSATSPC